jgi:thiol-disulfide isomerase/thioredoxin
MGDIQQGLKTTGSRRGPLTYVLWGLALIGLAAALYVIADRFIKPGPGGDLKAVAHGDMAGLSVASAGAAAPGTVFIDADGRPVHLADLKGHVLVVNLWATWCGPCVKEMPSLAKLQAAYAGKLVVVPISMDRAADREKARAFMAEHAPLPFYQDQSSALAFALSPPAEGFPTTVLYDAGGHEKARLSSDADWSGADAHAVVDALLRGG